MEITIDAVDIQGAPDINTNIIRTHGVSSKVYVETSKMGYNVTDTNCPFVKKAQYITSLKEKGYQGIIIQKDVTNCRDYRWRFNAAVDN